MRQVIFLAGLFSMVLLLTPGCSTPQTVETPEATAVTVFEGGLLITGDGQGPIEDSAFMVENDRFTAVGRRGQLEIPPGAARVDLRGKTIMPAIIDTHKHVAADRETLVDQLQHLAYHGVGVVMSLGLDVGDVAFRVREEIVPNASQLLTAGRGITTPEPGRSEAPYWITSQDQARSAVQELAGRRVNLVKIWVDTRNGKYEKLSPDLYGAIIDEAHQNGLRVTAHIFELEDATELLSAGIDAFAHGVRDRDVDQEFVELFTERPDVVLVPNLPDRGVEVDMSWLGESVPAGELQRLQTESTDRPAAQEAFGIQARNLARLNAAGVRIAFGTDGSTSWAPHVEMADMVAAGMTPSEVIVAATRNSADLLQLTDVGTVEEGKRADFIVLNANPLDNIENTRRIAAVYLRGTEVDRAALRARWNAETAP